MEFADLDNLTPFGYDTAFGYDLNDTIQVVLCVAGCFKMPPPGKVYNKDLELFDEQSPPPMADEHWSDPANSSLRYAGQGAIHRQGVDIYLQGSAWAPKGYKVKEMRTIVQVNNYKKELNVIGDRYWLGGLVLRASNPQPFESMPLIYERSFGGTSVAKDGRIIAQEARNPVGRGIYGRRRDAINQPLPNLEAPGERLNMISKKATPWGYGPIACNWQPRISYAGTYDQKWIDERLPLWPRDTDIRFFSAAAPGLNISAPLVGGEPVLLKGFSPDGAFCFRLPQYRVIAKSYYMDHKLRNMMRLDGILFETDEKAVTLYWRCAVPLGRGRKTLQHSVVRLLESWEEVST